MTDAVERYAMRYGQMCKSPHGIWVRHDQHAAEVARLTADKRLIMEERDSTFALMLTRAETAEAEVARLREANDLLEKQLATFRAQFAANKRAALEAKP